MNQHYESYRASVQKDVLPGFVDFAKTTALRDGRTVFDYLQLATKELQSPLDDTNYRVWLEGHQQAMLGALERFVQAQPEKDLNLAAKGWRWYRFGKYPVHIHGTWPMVWVPRHDPAIQDICFDALELEHFIGKAKGDPLTRESYSKIAKEAYTRKSEEPSLRFIDGVGWIDRADVNTTKIDDWTARLFV